MTLPKRLLLVAAAITAAISSVPAADVFQARPSFENPWLRPPLTGQKTNAHAGLVFGGHVGAYAIPGEGNTPTVPRNNQFQLKDSSFGQTFPGLRPDFKLGDEITPIPGADLSQAPVVTPATGAFYVQSRRAVIAADNGPVRIDWKMKDGSTVSRVYLISISPTKRPARLFWTEFPYNAPPVDLTKRFVTIHYNSNVRFDAQHDPTTEDGIRFADTNLNLKTVWVDKQGFLKARGARGSFILEYFKTGGKQEHIGFEIVEVMEPVVTTISATIGSRLLPLSTDFGSESLIPDIRHGLPDAAYWHRPQAGAGHFNNWVFPITRTIDEPWDLEIYWKHTGVLDVQWPFEVDWYAVDWPPDSQAQTYVRSGTSTNASVSFPTSLNVELMDFQEPAQHARLAPESPARFYTVGAGHSLLRYSTADDVWFQVVRSVESANTAQFNRSPIPWEIGQEILPIDVPQPVVVEGNPAQQIPLPLKARPIFDGVSNKLSVSLSRAAHTIEFWCRPADVGGSGILSIRANDRPAAYRLILDAEGRIVLEGDHGTGVIGPRAVAGDWRHLAIIISPDNSFAQLTVDGVEMKGLALPSELIPGVPFSFHFGVSSAAEKNFSGEFRQIRCWARSLNPFEITQIMHQEHPVAQVGLLAAFSMDKAILQPDGSIAVPSENGLIAPWSGPFVQGGAPLHLPVRSDLSRGYVKQETGSAYNASLYTWPDAGTHLFGVNSGLLEVWWSQVNQQPFMPEAVAWPAEVRIYTNIWPLAPKELVIAGQNSDSSGVLEGGWTNTTLYYQNNPHLPGYNPNEEHAMIVSGRVYALRDDLNTTNSSSPYVLVQYNDPANGNLPAMEVLRVIETNDVHQFAQPVYVGQLMQPPMPLTVLPRARGTRFEDQAFKDRNHEVWSTASGADGSPVNTRVRFFYPVQEGFAFPDSPLPPAPGDEVGWLTKGSTIPITYVYTNLWPTDAPVLELGETLVSSKRGLPSITGQKSVAIFFDQSFVHSNKQTVVLIDPTRDRSARLAALPAVNSEIQDGKIYFPLLPPHLRSRLFYDPIAHLLTLRGKYVQPPAGESYLLLNALPGDSAAASSDRGYVYRLSNDSSWRAAVDQLPALPEAMTDPAAFDSLALAPSGAGGVGFVVLGFNTSDTLAALDDPISFTVIRVAAPLYKGQITPIFSGNPLDEKLTMRFTGDFGGRLTSYEFDWRYMPPGDDGQADSRSPDQWISFFGKAQTGANSVTIEGAGLLTLADNYFAVRYRPIQPTNSAWSEWTEPALAEGWIKRALDGINPFEQRIADLENNRVNSTVSLISQAGARWRGDVPLNLNNIDEHGLIEIYETILKRGINLSIGSGFSYNSVNDALLLAAGRIHDLYMALGNEAYGDSLDPTIAYGTRDKWVFGSEGSGIFCFEGQAATLLDEELALLRGRDDSLAPSVQTHPVYNRLYWNFTKGLNGGEAAYALNYNIPNADGDVEGTIDEADAAKLFPQGHGDAWGHYLSAAKVYYQLLSNTNFTWSPRIEARIIGGVSVNIDYFDERKFAEAAAAKAKAGADIVNLVNRKLYTQSESGVAGFRDDNSQRAWGSGEWASRAGQGAFFDWVTANSLLPDVDPDPSHAGIQKIDRTTVPELNEIAAQFDAIQLRADQADRRLNPLGIARDSIPFDIDPRQLDSGKTHFEQIYDRAVTALNNANESLLHAQNSGQVLRRQNASLQDFNNATAQSEQDYSNRMIELYGYPYSDDIGAGKLYPQGYEGPDFFHYQYVDFHGLFGNDNPEVVVNFTNQFLGLTVDGIQVAVGHNPDFEVSEIIRRVEVIPLTVVQPGIPAKPASYTGARRAEGKLQEAHHAYVRAWYDLKRSVAQRSSLQASIEERWKALDERGQMMNERNTLETITSGALASGDVIIRASDFFQGLRADARHLEALEADALAWGLPLMVIAGLADGGDFSFPGREVALQSKVGVYAASTIADKVAKGAKLLAEVGKRVAQGMLDTQIRNWNFKAEINQLVIDLNDEIRRQSAATSEVVQRAQVMYQARERYRVLVAEGDRLLAERTAFRARAASRIQQDRYTDSVFRIFQNEALGQYRAAADLAARYTYLAAKAYDYETGFIQSSDPDEGNNFINKIVSARSLGHIRNGQPQLGSGQDDPGLANVLARMKADWEIVRGRFRFNNPATEQSRFSLRTELLRIASPNDPEQAAHSDETWRSALWSYKVNNLLALPEFQRRCLPFSPQRDTEPALVIPFSTAIQSGQNFFGRPLAGGDSAFDSSHFATKIRAVGIWFNNYNNTGLANQPRVYLVPVGNDIQRSPLTQTPIMWSVVDQALPLPFALGNSDLLDKADWIPIIDSLAGSFNSIRQFASLRAYHDSGQFDPSQLTTDARLVGRSAWNTQWLLIIPGSTFLSDPEQGLEIFVNGAQNDGNGVKDIKISFQTYSYSGN